METARDLAERIAHDVHVRKGVGDEWDMIDDDIREGIVSEWEAMIARVLGPLHDAAEEVFNLIWNDDAPYVEGGEARLDEWAKKYAELTGKTVE